MKGTWVDETDIQPTLMYLTGLRDDYTTDGRVISQILTDPNQALSGQDVTALAACYKQLDSSVGQFGADTLIASTKAVTSDAAGDALFTSVNAELFTLEQARDALANQIKDELSAAAFWNMIAPLWSNSVDTTTGAIGAVARAAPICAGNARTCPIPGPPHHFPAFAV